MLQNVVGAKLHKSHTTFFFNPNFFLFSLGPFLLASQNVLCYKIYFIAQVLYLVINFSRENSDFEVSEGVVSEEIVYEGKVSFFSNSGIKSRG